MLKWTFITKKCRIIVNIKIFKYIELKNKFKIIRDLIFLLKNYKFYIFLHFLYNYSKCLNIIVITIWKNMSKNYIFNFIYFKIIFFYC